MLTCKAVAQLVRAIEDGYDVRGLTMWTLVRNFEWGYGWTKDFGLYGWSPDDPTNARVLHDSTMVSTSLTILLVMLPGVTNCSGFVECFH